MATTHAYALPNQNAKPNPFIDQWKDLGVWSCLGRRGLDSHVRTHWSEPPLAQIGRDPFCGSSVLGVASNSCHDMLFMLPRLSHDLSFMGSHDRRYGMTKIGDQEHIHGCSALGAVLCVHHHIVSIKQHQFSRSVTYIHIWNHVQRLSGGESSEQTGPRVG